ncbi:MAG: VCBS repeat-containing protein [Solirubrobacteraceae bacterium]|nr:VCBS repeat-containing protein [Solirubrobacteraceae bacterium]
MSSFVRRSALLLPCLAVSALAAPAAAPAATTAELHTTITGFAKYEMRAQEAGDVNGDGRADVLVSSGYCGPVRVVFGAAAGGTVSLDALGARGLTITGPDGECITPVRLGDVNGDGRDDIGLAPNDNPYRAEITPGRVVFGRAAGTVDAGALGSAGLTLTPGSGVTLRSMFRVGDVNGDGKADVGLAETLTLPGGTPRTAAGALFGRAAGGSIPVSTATGLHAVRGGEPGSADNVAEVSPAGDVNGDGKGDMIVALAPRNTQLVYGRTTAGVVDVAALGASGADIPGQEGAVWDPLGDINGDKLPDYATTLLSGNDADYPQVAMFSSRTGPLFPLADPASRGLKIRASLGDLGFGQLGATGDLNGDGRGEVSAVASYPIRSSNPDNLNSETDPLSLNYLVAGTTATRSVDLRIAGSWGIRLDAIPDRYSLVGGLRFTGAGKGQVLAEGATQLRVYDVVDRPAPAADTTAPVVSNLRFANARIRGACGALCFTRDPAQTNLTFSVGERAYVDLSFRRDGTSSVITAKGSMYPGPAYLRVYGQSGKFGGNLLPAGRWTATLTATDMAGNKSAPVTASITVL